MTLIYFMIESECIWENPEKVKLRRPRRCRKTKNLPFKVASSQRVCVCVADSSSYSRHCFNLFSLLLSLLVFIASMAANKFKSHDGSAQIFIGKRVGSKSIIDFLLATVSYCTSRRQSHQFIILFRFCL